jgi:hypothetical protein
MKGRGGLSVVLVVALAAACPAGAWTQEPVGGLDVEGRTPEAADGGLDRETAPLDAEGATQVFREGNALYADARYEEAAARYERVLAGGLESAEVRYNLANAYYKAGATGRAVLNYERALRLDPGHDDARANLEFVRETLADRQAKVGGPFSESVEHLYVRLTPPRLAAWASVFYFLFIGALIVGIVRSGLVGWVARLAVVTGLLLLLTGGLLVIRSERIRSVRDAVVLASEVAVRTGPGEDFMLEFRLHEGTKVRVREGRGQWARVSVSGTDLEGWLPAGSIEVI